MSAQILAENGYDVSPDYRRRRISCLATRAHHRHSEFGYFMSPDSRTLTNRELTLLLDARDMMESGEARRLRQRAGLSLRQAASLVGVTHMAIKRWETRERLRPRGSAGIRYACFLARLAERERAAQEPAA
jgi:DNA-binding transcriptional regulator YiaG